MSDHKINYHSTASPPHSQKENSILRSNVEIYIELKSFTMAMTFDPEIFREFF
jgi:hypothetical protein